MVNFIEEPLQINVNDVLITGIDVVQRFLYGLMGVALWPETKTVLRKHILIVRHNDAYYRLLQHPFNNRGDSR